MTAMLVGGYNNITAEHVGGDNNMTAVEIMIT